MESSGGIEGLLMKITHTVTGPRGSSSLSGMRLWGDMVRACRMENSPATRQRIRPAASGESSSAMKRSSLRKRTGIESLEFDILCIIFSFLDFFDLARCTAVCKSWHEAITKSKLLRMLFYKQHRDYLDYTPKPNISEQSLLAELEKLAMKHHTSSLLGGGIDIDQWKGHSAGVNQCRMKMGLLLTGVGDKVIRLWSLDCYKCIHEYPVSDTAPLIDFDFDESKIVGLIGTRLNIWRRNGKRSIFPSNEGTFSKGTCMRYFDPEAIVGCEDGTIRIFDMYSKRCSQIFRLNYGPVSCLALTDEQLILSGSSLGSIKICDLSSEQEVATLRRTDRTGIKALCFNTRSYSVFAGTSAGYTCCWDLRTMKSLWETRASSNVIYSVQHMRNDTSILAVGGIDGVLRLQNQNSGDILSVCYDGMSAESLDATVQRKKGRRLLPDIDLDKIPRIARPPITCLAVGMKKVVTTHNSRHIKVWKFDV